MDAVTVNVAFHYNDQDINVHLAKYNKNYLSDFGLHKYIEENRPEIAVNYEFNTDLILDTIQRKIPEAEGSEGKRIFAAYIVTAVLVATVVAAIFVCGTMTFSLEAQISAVSLAVVANLFSYIWFNPKFVFPEKRLYRLTPPGPWYHPNISTVKGYLTAITLVWPVIMGMISPLLEAYSLKARWEDVLERQKEQLVKNVPQLCMLYKEWGQNVLKGLEAKKSKQVWDSAIRRDEEMIARFQMMADFLRHFDATVPKLNPTVS